MGRWNGRREKKEKSSMSKGKGVTGGVVGLSHEMRKTTGRERGVITGVRLRAC